MEKATKSQAVNGIDHTTIMTPLRVKEAIQANGGGGGSYTPGDAIAIQNNQISVKYDNSTITLDSSGRLKANTGTQDYSDLSNKPKINNVTLDGNKTSADLGVQPTISDLATIRQGATEGLSALQPGDNISELVNNVGYITQETDPVFSSSPAHGITSANISSWTGKSTVTFTPSLTGGTKVGDLTIDGTTTSLYAPTSSQVPVYFLKNDGSEEDLAIINEVCAKHSSNEDFLLVGTFSDYATGKVFKAPMSVVRYNDERDEAMSFTTPLINLTDDSSSSYKEHYIQMALFFEGTWGAYTYSGSYRLSTLTPSDYLTQEEDPVFTQSAASGITSSDISNWDAKSEVSYNQIVTSGTKIAEINIDGTTTDIYAPQGGGGGITFDDVYPVGSIYMSANNVDPGTLFGGTWERLSGGFVYGAVSTYGTSTGNATQTSAASGDTGSTVLTAAQSGLPAHSHGLNGHTHSMNFTSGSGDKSHSHSIPALSGTAASAGGHTHNIKGGANVTSSGGSEGVESYASRYSSFRNINDPTPTYSSGDHTHSVTTTASTTGSSSISHTHNISGTTAGNSGSTANNGAASASSGHSHTLNSHRHDLSYIAVFIWRRTA